MLHYNIPDDRQFGAGPYAASLRNIFNIMITFTIIIIIIHNMITNIINNIINNLIITIIIILGMDRTRLSCEIREAPACCRHTI